MNRLKLFLFGIVAGCILYMTTPKDFFQEMYSNITFKYSGNYTCIQGITYNIKYSKITKGGSIKSNYPINQDLINRLKNLHPELFVSKISANWIVIDFHNIRRPIRIQKEIKKQLCK